MNRRQTLLSVALAISLTNATYAGSAIWKTNPVSNDWKTAANWSPATVPNAASDIATFGSSSVADVSIPSGVQVGGIVFNQGGSAFTITVGSPTDFVDFSVQGDIANNTGKTQNLVTSTSTNGVGDIFFFGNATVGDKIVITNGKESLVGSGGGFIRFGDTSNAANATIVNESNASTVFGESASAGNAMITNAGGAANNQMGGETFVSTINTSVPATAGNATIVNNGGTVPGAEGGRTSFIARATAGNAILIANGGSANGGKGGTIRFTQRTTGGTARVKVFGNGNLDISAHATHGVTMGSIEGNGLVFLGQNELSVGSNNLDTAFSGIVKDGGPFGGTGGSLAKIGNGTLTLSRANIYTGGTSVNSGVLLINNGSGSGTGSGPVLVTGGGLGGNGTIAGSVSRRGLRVTG